ncbi:NOL8 family protein [Megaselia abdita]
MESKRFFVNNLPPGTVDGDLQRLFQDYGEIEKIEVKTKENLVDPQNPKVLAFVTLSIKDKLVDQCVNDLCNYKVKGQYLSVSVAKESFLERLKRERANEGKKSEEEKPQFTDAPVNVAVPKRFDPPSTQNTTIKFDEDLEVGDLDDDDQVVYQSISKKKASHSLQNGKIKIASVSSEPIHIISSKPKVKEQDEKAKKADQKRKESLNKKKTQTNQQKNAIQMALSAVDGGKSKKIVFDDDGEIDSGFENSENGPAPKKAKKQKLELFDEEEEEGDFNLDIKEQFHGKKGAKLMKLQSKMGLDPRFKMDSNFLEDDEEENVEEEEKGPTEFDERKWQMNLIEQSLGKKVDHSTGPMDGKKKQKRSMQRYDPSMEEKFLKQKPSEEEVEQLKKLADRTPEVSKEIFYSVTDDLSKSLKRRGDGFSLLSMFGNQVPEESEVKEEYMEKILVKKGEKPSLAGRMDFESSDSEDELAQLSKEKEEKKKGGKMKGGVWTENFFFVDGDIRFKEGANFFKATEKSSDAPVQDYDKVKDNLRQIINKKISKTKKILNKNKGLHKNHKTKSKKK